MSVLRRSNTNPEDMPTDKLILWIDNAPDFYDMQATYTAYGKQKATIRKLQRTIDRIEDEIAIEQDKPRSNDAKKAKLTATSSLKDTLAELEADLYILESKVKMLEYQRSMFNAATFRHRMTNEI